MYDEPLTIPEAQQTRITVERLGGWQVIGWVQDSGWEAVVNNGEEWGLMYYHLKPILCQWI